MTTGNTGVVGYRPTLKLQAGSKKGEYKAKEKAREREKRRKNANKAG